MAYVNLGEIVTTTIQNRQKRIADNTSNNNAFLRRCKSKGKMKFFSGGDVILEELDFQDNSTVGSYSGYDLLDMSAVTVLDAAQYSIKQYAGSVSMSGLEELQNSGQEQMIDLLEARIANLERSMANKISDGIYSAGTGNNSKDIGGLQYLVEDTGSSSTSTVGGIARGTYSFWENVSYDATTDGGAAATSANIKPYMNRVYVQLVRGSDAPDLGLCDNTYYRLFLEDMQGLQRIGSEDLAKAGFETIKYLTMDIVLDGGVGADCPTNHMYFLNTDYLYFKTHRKRNFVVIGPSSRYGLNQDAFVRYLGWAGNMTMSCAKLQGVLKD